MKEKHGVKTPTDPKKLMALVIDGLEELYKNLSNQPSEVCIWPPESTHAIVQENQQLIAQNREMINLVQDRLDLLISKLSMIFGNQILINGRWVTIFDDEEELKDTLQERE